ncbi:glycosyltransferase [Neolewinella agarilytica]|nr:glycosyltransferase [Neolewinella agarilytica]
MKGHTFILHGESSLPKQLTGNVEYIYNPGDGEPDFCFSLCPLYRYGRNPGVTSVLDIDFKKFFQKKRWWQRLPPDSREYYSETLKGTASIVVSHSALKEEILKFYDIESDKIKVVGYGPPEAPVYPADEVTRRITKEVYGKENSFFFAPAIGHTSDNLERLFAAYDRFRQRVPEPVRLLVAQPETGKHLKAVRRAHRQAKYRKDIEFLPRLSDHEYRKIFSSARAILYPSLSTRFPLPVLDAWTAEVPVVYTDNDILRGAGALVQGEDINSIAEGMVSLVTTPFLASGLVENGKRRLQDFSWEAVAEKVAEVLRSVTDQSSSRSSEQ